MAPELVALPSATWFDETLVSARTANKLVVVRFGRSSDPLCQQCDAMLREAVDMPEMASVLSIYTVDVQDVPEFTYMYELYDPYAVMLFHQSKPLVFDAGYGPVRKLTEIASGPWLRALLLRVVCGALDVRLTTDTDDNTAGVLFGSPGTLSRLGRLGGLGSPSIRSGGAGGAGSSTDAPDAPASLKEEATRLARDATEWLDRKSESIGTRVGAAMEQSGGWLQQVEERSWSALSRAGTSGLAALSSAREHLRQRATGAPPAAGSVHENVGTAAARSPEHEAVEPVARPARVDAPVSVPVESASTDPPGLGERV